jgi:hypothetical protein
MGAGINQKQATNVGKPCSTVANMLINMRVAIMELGAYRYAKDGKNQTARGF